MEKISLVIDPDKMTLGDMEDFEDFVGKSLDEAVKETPVRDESGALVLDEKGRPVLETKVTAKTIRCLVWIIRRKTDPEFTLEDARNVFVSQLEMVTPDATPDAEKNDVTG
jgi:hypothetical protein